MITADGAGSNGSRLGLWKRELQPRFNDTAKLPSKARRIDIRHTAPVHLYSRPRIVVTAPGARAERLPDRLYAGVASSRTWRPAVSPVVHPAGAWRGMGQMRQAASTPSTHQVGNWRVTLMHHSASPGGGYQRGTRQKGMTHAYLAGTRFGGTCNAGLWDRCR